MRFIKDFQHPSSVELVMIKAGQASRWRELNALPSWNEQQFTEVLFCHNEYKAELREWVVSEESIQRLAFDARTPDEVAVKLQQVANQMKKAKP